VQDQNLVSWLRVPESPIGVRGNLRSIQEATQLKVKMFPQRNIHFDYFGSIPFGSLFSLHISILGQKQVLYIGILKETVKFVLLVRWIQRQHDTSTPCNAKK
jgi:hypothetical protein